MESVWILFGDVPRSDGENIIGVYNSYELATKSKERWEVYRDDMTFTIESFVLENK